mmetsp:Transcript_17/g.29  ORF Transcript_17/g.29 Transcript_17/m.29 type:complete len:305 (-) Transcript_17:888-1802(-)
MHMSRLIHTSQIDYLKTFQVVCQKLGLLFDNFVTPNLVWKMVNYISNILEKNTESPEKLIECLNQLNINKLLQLNSEQVHDALIDMLKHLLAQQSASPVILEMCVALLDHCLTKTQHLDDVLIFWVFVSRITSVDNPNKLSLKNLFMKFCVSYGSVKKEHLFIEFLKVAQECALMGCFDTQLEVQQIIEFAFQKFQAEIDFENKLMAQRQHQKSQKGNYLSCSDSSSGDNDDSDFCEGSSFFEKKLHILHIPHIILWKTVNQSLGSGTSSEQCMAQIQQDSVIDFILLNQKKFILQVTQYMVSN